MNNQLLEAVQQIRDEIFESYIAKGLVASGEFGRELIVESDAGSVRITAPHYVEQMEKGRKPGSFPPLSAIKKWITDKNRTAGTNIPEEAAFAIALTIKRQGIKVPNKYNGGGVVSSVLNEDRVRRLSEEFNLILSARIADILR